MPVLALQRHRGQLPVGDPDAQRVVAPVKLGVDPQARAGAGRPDQLDDDLDGYPPIYAAVPGPEGSPT